MSGFDGSDWTTVVWLVVALLVLPFLARAIARDVIHDESNRFGRRTRYRLSGVDHFLVGLGAAVGALAWPALAAGLVLAGLGRLLTWGVR